MVQDPEEHSFRYRSILSHSTKTVACSTIVDENIPNPGAIDGHYEGKEDFSEKLLVREAREEEDNESSQCACIELS